MRTIRSSTKISIIFILSIGTVIGIAYAPALITITLGGDVVVTNDMEVNGSITSPSITDLESRIGVIEGGG